MCSSSGVWAEQLRRRPCIIEFVHGSKISKKKKKFLLLYTLDRAYVERRHTSTVPDARHSPSVLVFNRFLDLGAASRPPRG